MKYRLLLVALIFLFSVSVVAVLEVLRVDVDSFAEVVRERFAETVEPDSRIVLAGLTDELFENGLFTREVHAHVLGVLKECGASVVFYDVVFDENRDPLEDQLLCDALLAWPGVVLAGTTTTTETGHIQEPRLAPSLDEAVNQGRAILGSIEKAEDDDGVLRQYVLALGFGRDNVETSTVPSAALACYSLLQSVRPSEIQYKDGVVELPPLPIPVEEHLAAEGDGSFTKVYAFPVNFHAPATGPGNKAGPGTYRLISYIDLIEPSEELREELRGKVIIVGENTSLPDDIVTTPVGRMKGFEAHAQCLDRLLHHEFYTSVPETVNFQIALGLTALVASLGLLTWPLSLLLLAGGSIVCAYGGLALWLFTNNHLLMDMGTPIAGALSALASLVIVRLMLASRFLGRFIPREASRGLLMSKQMALSGVATVIVTDIRGYTTISETKTPVEMLALLNEYHSITVDIYHKHGGNVLTFQGDAQLVVFGYPKKLKDPVLNAVESTVEVMEAIAELRKKWGIDDPDDFDVGAGICTGDVYIGDIGSAEQANYTVIGEVVRTSHKVQAQSTALKGNVLLDAAAYHACKNKPNVTRIDGVQLEGFPEKKTLYRVETGDPPEQ